MPRRGRSGVNQFSYINAWPSSCCRGAAVAHSAGAAAGPTGAVVELAGAAVGLLRGCWGGALTGALGALKVPKTFPGQVKMLKNV